MRAIAVHPGFQGQKIGAGLARATEDALRRDGHRVLIVETSGTDTFTQTRAFYTQNGYDLEARIRNFWDENDDKAIFRKRL
jgi:ribosomal protein S18 acetylase RimI-like enzyme